MWLITVISSLGMQGINKFRIFKDVMDNGYKISLKKISKFSSSGTSDTKNSLIPYLIPVFNLFYVLQSIVNYNESRFYLLDQLRVMNVLEKMSDFETKEYLKKPTILNALIVNFKSETNMYNIERVSFNIDGEEGEIDYILEEGHMFENINIVGSKGAATRMTVEEQQNKVIECFNEVVKAIVVEYSNLDNFSEEVDDNDNNNVVVKSDRDKILKLEEQKQSLEELKEELLKSKHEEQNDDNKGNNYSKKIK